VHYKHLSSLKHHIYDTKINTGYLFTTMTTRAQPEMLRLRLVLYGCMRDVVGSTGICYRGIWGRLGHVGQRNTLAKPSAPALAMYAFLG
jgi:hypothetical protein